MKLANWMEFSSLGFPWIFFNHWIMECLTLSPDDLSTDLTTARLDSPGFISPLFFDFSPHHEHPSFSSICTPSAD